MHLIEEAFGEECDLYEVLDCKRDADKASLRKAYYRRALKFHPDKNPGDNEAAKNFQAVSLTYQILSDPDLRQEYDESGVIPHNDAVADDDKETSGADAWRKYFTGIFGSVTVAKIEAFAAKYKCSDEEKRDVLKFFRQRKGNLVKMIECVMLSENVDAVRWVEDYISPAMEKGELETTHREAMEKSLKKVKKQIEKEAEAKASAASDDETETEEEDDDRVTKGKKRAAPKKESPSSSSKKKSRSSRKKENNNNSMDDLIAQIQNKNKRAPNVLANLGSRYGVDMGADDPLSDADFAKTQAKMEAKRRKKR